MSPTQDCFVSVVAPLHDDADIVTAFVSETLAVLERHYSNYELLLIDDGSTDDTPGRVQELLAHHPCIRLMRLSRRFGPQTAIAAGLDSVIGDFVAIMDPNTDPPDVLPAMIEQSRNGAGIVFGLRRTRRGETLLSRMGAACFYWLANSVLRLGIPKDATDLRVLSRQAVNAVTQVRDRLRYLGTMSTYVGYANQGFRYDMISRRARPTRKGLWTSISLAIGIIVGNSLLPLRLVSLLGIVASITNLGYMAYVLLVYFFAPEVAPGWTTQSLQQAAFYVCVFVCLAVIAEYLGRVLEQTRDRPLYFVLGEWNSSVLIADEGRRNVVTDPAGRASDATDRPAAP